MARSTTKTKTTSRRKKSACSCGSSSCNTVHVGSFNVMTALSIVALFFVTSFAFLIPYIEENEIVFFDMTPNQLSLDDVDGSMLTAGISFEYLIQLVTDNGWLNPQTTFAELQRFLNNVINIGFITGDDVQKAYDYLDNWGTGTTTPSVLAVQLVSTNTSKTFFADQIGQSDRVQFAIKFDITNTSSDDVFIDGDTVATSSPTVNGTDGLSWTRTSDSTTGTTTSINGNLSVSHSISGDRSLPGNKSYKLDAGQTRRFIFSTTLEGDVSGQAAVRISGIKWTTATSTPADTAYDQLIKTGISDLYTDLADIFVYGAVTNNLPPKLEFISTSENIQYRADAPTEGDTAEFVIEFDVVNNNNQDMYIDGDVFKTSNISNSTDGLAWSYSKDTTANITTVSESLLSFDSMIGDRGTPGNKVYRIKAHSSRIFSFGIYGRAESAGDVGIQLNGLKWVLASSTPTSDVFGNISNFDPVKGGMINVNYIKALNPSVSVISQKTNETWGPYESHTISYDTDDWATSSVKLYLVNDTESKSKLVKTGVAGTKGYSVSLSTNDIEYFGNGSRVKVKACNNDCSVSAKSIRYIYLTLSNGAGSYGSYGY